MDSFIGRTVFGLDQKRKEVGNEREGSWKTVGITESSDPGRGFGVRWGAFLSARRVDRTPGGPGKKFGRDRAGSRRVMAVDLFVSLFN